MGDRKSGRRASGTGRGSRTGAGIASRMAAGLDSVGLTAGVQLESWW
jgi:hypothetical protein